MKKLSLVAASLLLAGLSGVPSAHAIRGLFGGMEDTVTKAIKTVGAQGKAKLLFILKEARDKVAAVLVKEAKATRRATAKLLKEAEQAAGALFFTARKGPKAGHGPLVKKAKEDAAKLRAAAAARAEKLAADAHARARERVAKARDEVLKLLRKGIKPGKGLFRALKGLALPAKLPALRFLPRR